MAYNTLQPKAAVASTAMAALATPAPASGHEQPLDQQQHSAATTFEEYNNASNTFTSFSNHDGHALSAFDNGTSSAGTTLADDFFSSPEWTDPSPALTNSMSFGIDSCDTSPLLTDNYDAPEFAGLPLFGDQSLSLFSNGDAQASSSTAGSTLSPKRAPQNAFNAGKTNGQTQDTALQLLRALSSAGIGATFGSTGTNDLVRAAAHALSGAEQASAVAPAASVPADQPPVPTASPSVFSLSAPSTTTTTTTTALVIPRASERAPSPPAAALTTPDVPAASHASGRPRGLKRRLESTDLLPLNAPIQPRKYRLPSATSRKGSTPGPDSSAATSDDGAAEVPSTPMESGADPVFSKRLSNTLAARRSRHRKAEELRALHDQISSLTAEVELWKQRCFEAERQRDCSH